MNATASRSMSLTPRQKGFAVFFIVALVALGFWLRENFEFQEVRYPSSLKGEALTNNYLAAQRLAGEMGAKASTVNGMKVPKGSDAAGTVIVAPSQRRTFTPNERQQFLDWLARGGHAVVVAHTMAGDGERADWLIEAAGVTQHWSRQARAVAKSRAQKSDQRAGQEDGERDPVENDPNPERPLSQREIRELSNDGPNIPFPLRPKARTCPAVFERGSMEPRIRVGDRPATACFKGHYHLRSKRAPLWTLGSEGNLHAVTVSYGNGTVTVLTEAAFMRNQGIETSDHADLLVAILGFNDPQPPREVIFVPREDAENIVILTWRNATLVVLLLACWLALWLWRVSTRLGPLLPAASLARRSLAEHVRAVGEFCWQRGALDTLWRATLRSTQRAVEQRFPRNAYADRDAQLAAVALAVRLERAIIENAIGGVGPPHPPGKHDFAKSIATLEHIRKSL